MPPVGGGVIAREGFIEARMPLIEDMPGAQSWIWKPATATRATTWASRPTPTSSASSGRPFRRSGCAAASRARFAPRTSSSSMHPPRSGWMARTPSDPCAGPPRRTPRPSARRPGVQRGQSVREHRAESGRPVQRLARRQSGLAAGDGAITASFGIGWTPSYIPNFRAQVDYYDIQIENVIQSTGGTDILECATQGIYCNLIHRDTSNGSLWLSESGFISDSIVNDAGLLREKGVDVDIAYSYDVGAFGKLHSGIAGTYISQYDEIPSQIYPRFAYNCAGLYGPVLQQPDGRRRHAGVPLAASLHDHLGDALERSRCDARLALLQPGRGSSR